MGPRFSGPRCVPQVATRPLQQAWTDEPGEQTPGMAEGFHGWERGLGGPFSRGTGYGAGGAETAAGRPWELLAAAALLRPAPSVPGPWRRAGRHLLRPAAARWHCLAAVAAHGPPARRLWRDPAVAGRWEPAHTAHRRPARLVGASPRCRRRGRLANGYWLLVGRTSRLSVRICPIGAPFSLSVRAIIDRRQHITTRPAELSTTE